MIYVVYRTSLPVDYVCAANINTVARCPSLLNDEMTDWNSSKLSAAATERDTHGLQFTVICTYYDLVQQGGTASEVS